MERYRPATIYMTATIQVLVDDEKELLDEQDQKMTNQAIDFVNCLNAPEISWDMAEFCD